MSRYILPLYSFSKRRVMPGSGLNQGAANGRRRDLNEVYIPIPKVFYDHYGHVLPNRNTSFNLTLPDGTILSAKVCQDNDKSIMSNPNSDLGQWLFQQLSISSTTVVSNLDLTNAGFDSVILEDDGNGGFNISIYRTQNAFQQLMNEPNIF